jgi:hypothetical protein
MKKLLLLFIFIVAKQLIFSQCLNGIYTIGGTSPSYTSITQAVNTLSVNGVCGPVTFNIRPGTYNEKVIIPAIVGTSSVNTITFQSENGDSTAVTIQAVGASGTNYVFQLNGADFVTIRKLTLKNTNVNYSNILFLTNGSINCNIKNCDLISPVTSFSSTNPDMYLINSWNVNNTNLTIQNNKITGGQRAVHSTTNTGMVVSGNNFINQYEYAVYLYANYCPIISSNTFTSNSTYITHTSIYAATCTGSVVIEKNAIDLLQAFAIQIYPNNNSTSTNSRICNNRINILGGTSSNSAIVLQACTKLDIYHNTIVSTNTNSLSTLLNCIDINNLNIQNNILCQKGAGTIYNLGFIFNTVSNTDINHNNIFCNGSLIANNYGTSIQTFGTWRNLGYDISSIYIIPQFVSSSDFHIASDFSQNLILPYFNFVSDDIEGNIRDITSPYFGAYEIANPQNANDAAIDRIDLGSVVCPGNKSLNVLLRNYGINPLISATLNWSINGALQTPVNWTGNLGFYDSLSVVLGNINFVDLNSYNLKVWTSVPNGASDNYTTNDTITSGTLYTALSGTYTIGGSAPTFTSINTAITSLVNRGVCGNSVFNIRNGIYNENLNLPAIKGLNGTNTLIFQAESGVAGNVVIASTTTISTIDLKGINNTFFKNLSLGGFGILAPVVTVNSGSDNVEFNGCVINGSGYNGIDGTLTNKVFNHLHIVNNTFNNCSNALNITGNSNVNSFYYNNLIINNNNFSSIGGNLVKIQYCDTVEFNSNYGINTNTINGSLGYVSLSSINYINVLNNKFTANNLNAFGLSQVNYGGTVANNMFVTTGNLNTIGFTLSWPNYVNCVNNSINSSSTSSLSSAFLCAYQGYYFNFYNNCIQNEGTGVAMEEIQGASVPLLFRNNVYFTNGPNLIKYNSNFYQDLYLWKNAVQSDTNSLNVKPLFTSSTDLHVNEITLKGAGRSTFALITDDIDGQLRNSLTPDIGADEFLPLTLDAATNGFGFGGMICSGFNPVEVWLKNNGTTPLTSAKINCKVNSTTLSLYNWSGSLAPGTQTLVNIGSYNFNLGTSYTVKAWSTLPNGTADTFRMNDTIIKAYSSTGMTGIFTIGGSSPSYSTIASAVLALKYNGVCGPVIFNIRNGIYNEQVKIPNIKGSSSINTILFQSENLDSSLVSIEYNGSASMDYIINTDSTDYITFYKLGFKPLNTPYGNALTFSGRTSHVQIKNCSFIGQNINGYLLSMINCDSALVLNNRFYKGNIAVYIAGTRNKVLNNYFEDQSQFAINSGGEKFDYSSNNFNFPSAAGISVYLSSTSGGKISKNKIQYSVACNSAMLINYCGTFQNQIYVTNNFMSLNGGIGVSLADVQFLNLINNSINQNGSGSCLSYTNVTTSTSRNNIYSNASGYCVNTTGGNTSFSTNYNCFYSPGNQLINASGTPYSSLSAFNAVTSMDGNSIFANPQFISNTDLHTNCLAIDGAGQYNVNVSDDIDGDVRNAPVFDIGADEFVVPYTRVWPGDANSDLGVTSQDLYTLGLHYGSLGNPRDSISNLFIGHNSLDWNAQQLNNPYDLKFADCNGDSIIDMNDTLAINLNYNLVHAPKPLTIITNTLTDIYLLYNKPLYNAGDTVKADVIIGSSSNILSNIYGLSFMLGYDQSMVKANSEKMFYSNSWIGNINSTKITFNKIIHNSGLLDASLVRITHTDVTGYGKIGTFLFVLNDTITVDKLNMSIYNANKIDHNGLALPLISGLDSINVNSGIVTRVPERGLKEISISPNPTSDYVKINFPDAAEVSFKVELGTMEGKTILTKNISSSCSILDLNGLSKGMYILKLLLEDKSIKVFKLVIQ